MSLVELEQSVTSLAGEELFSFITDQSLRLLYLFLSLGSFDMFGYCLSSEKVSSLKTLHQVLDNCGGHFYIH